MFLRFYLFPTGGHEKIKTQSSKTPLQIFGEGFKGEPVLNFDPPIWSPSNYTITVVSETELSLTLAEGSKWSKYGGALVVKGINVGDGEVRARPLSALGGRSRVCFS